METRSGWYTPKEIVQLQGMPGTVQGVHKRAKREGWRVRKRLGVRGPAIEYNIFERVQLSPNLSPCSHTGKEHTVPDLHTDRLERIWCLAFQQCSESDKARLIRHLMAFGIHSFLGETEAGWVQVARALQKLPGPAFQKLLELCNATDPPPSCDR